MVLSAYIERSKKVQCTIPKWGFGLHFYFSFIIFYTLYFDLPPTRGNRKARKLRLKANRKLW